MKNVVFCAGARKDCDEEKNEHEDAVIWDVEHVLLYIVEYHRQRNESKDYTHNPRLFCSKNSP